MKIGYPCINLSLDCKGDRTFRLKSYSEERLVETVDNNLNCLFEILRFNVAHNLLFFRITSDLVPFASHPICKFDWQSHFHNKFQEIGNYIRTNDIRISMHPDQFTLINSPDKGVFERSLQELIYHAHVLDLMELNTSAKIQLHIGGVYKDKITSINRFVERFNELPDLVSKRLVIENDDRSYTLQDCLEVSSITDIPILLDSFHHEVKNSGESQAEAVSLASSTWRQEDGILMIDYSYQHGDGRRGAHSYTMNVDHFTQFLDITKSYDFDIMLEIKDKEKSALKAVEAAKDDKRFVMPI
ncbi:MAG: UV DNA damage repair endonuclease UvsE [Dehalococcoidia bacterium]|nr:MAG: UV DNA damage repair endonuclease UvsE [Dehalococcoidia bacterium]